MCFAEQTEKLGSCPSAVRMAGSEIWREAEKMGAEPFLAVSCNAVVWSTQMSRSGVSDWKKFLLPPDTKNRRASFFHPCWRAELSSPFLMLNQQILVMKVFFYNINYFLCDPQASLNYTLKMSSVCHQPCPFFLAPFADLPCLYIEIVTRIEYSIPHGECITGTEAASSHLCLGCAKRSKPNP